MPSPAEAIHYGDDCWGKVMVAWKSWKEQGLTEHRNWWPELYRAYCANFGKNPDAVTASFAETYESKRADLKTVAPME